MPAPMPGTILEVKVQAGDQIAKGQLLMILEAMKMENEILAPHDGTIAEVRAVKGASVNAGDPLVVFA
ncbi:acetyl-CoA carboxylase biotin carboxyl carrier protein subunit [Desulfoprunum benzoelyticum]|nr:acetyl-CoA carboxylase biotin carboxyl carrier protein subunit [Desulfoprunum benzoelyticum]